MKFTDEDLRAAFEDEFNFVEGEITIRNEKYPAAFALKKLDFLSYQSEFYSWLKEKVKDGWIKEDENGNYHDGENS